MWHCQCHCNWSENARVTLHRRNKRLSATARVIPHRSSPPHTVSDIARITGEGEEKGYGGMQGIT
eukprot:11604202-Prorocentrum_lima.AAC.1